MPGGACDGVGGSDSGDTEEAGVPAPSAGAGADGSEQAPGKRSGRRRGRYRSFMGSSSTTTVVLDFVLMLTLPV